jgi:hypothetical protein
MTYGCFCHRQKRQNNYIKIYYFLCNCFIDSWIKRSYYYSSIYGGEMRAGKYLFHLIIFFISIPAFLKVRTSLHNFQEKEGSLHPYNAAACARKLFDIDLFKFSSLIIET